ncbi:MAG TPA: CoB--CoM heterodisulfide reductase iron-sulfur subunit B family protein [bacterium]|nr:CoB--CoM heterodisulfide reductase iron-sulfur subunit B family protein [bacterium]HPR89719.1 CoB--CoM heterodisulfide reductase iron-sulfur subunit B family protein [bacterium]
MKMGYFPGCSMGGSSREYGESLLAIAPELDLQLEEIHDWNCCGASAAHNLNKKLSLALPARNLGLAGQQQLEELLVPCAACFSRLAGARHELHQDEALRHEIEGVIELPLEQMPRSLNILDVLQKVFPQELNGRLRHPFAHKVACYYGCLLVRPPAIAQFDRPEDPQVMDQIMQRIGAEPIDWAFKTECCGAGMSIPRTDLVGALCAKILEDAVSRGAEAIIVACPMCHSNLDMRRSAINKAAGKTYDIPVLYITQAIGLALGLPPKKLGLHRHIVPVRLPERAATPVLEPVSAQEES